MFQGCAFKFWAEKEFAILQKLTDSSVCAQQQEVPDTDNIPDNESLLENLSHALGSLLCKKTKPKMKKTNQTNEGNNQDPRNATTSASLVTPLNRKRRNSLDSMCGLSVRESHTFAQMKSVVSNLEVQITEINSLLKLQPNESFFDKKISDLQDKITQFDNSFKVNFQALTARVAKLELENDKIKSENTKLKSEVKHLKGKLKSIEHSFNEKLTQPGVQDNHRNPDKAENDAEFTFPASVPVYNRFSALQEITQSKNTTTPDIPHVASTSTSNNSEDNISIALSTIQVQL